MTGDRTSTPLPVACTLGAQDGSARMRRWKALADRVRPEALLSGHVLEVRYRSAPGVREELEALVAAERECCGFLAWEVAEEGDDPVLRVTADPARPDDLAPIAALYGA